MNGIHPGAVDTAGSGPADGKQPGEPGGPGLPRPLLDRFARRLHGRLVLPEGPDYHAARTLWNGMTDRRPACVARCRDDDDVVAAVNVARDNGLPLAVRGGGHGVAGQAVCEGGLVVDLPEMTDVDVDPEGRTVRAQGGCTLADLDRATQRYGLAVPLGVVSASWAGSPGSRRSRRRCTASPSWRFSPCPPVRARPRPRKGSALCDRSGRSPDPSAT
ncbi:FAD-dependent oxidoreductase [Streptomyces thermoalcalitolerans]|uniref:FAD-binding PCMH-type domain-containing protein n=1 Tax=Streptomyces thermoalcalitolerans TaxID=65605 RepID=A0ABN1NWB9_9ACTN